MIAAAEALPKTEAAAGRRWHIALAAVIILHLALAWFAREPGILTGQDDAEYLTLAQSLKQGTYRELYRANTPFHRQYPPGYPLLLAGWSVLAGNSFAALVLLNMLLSASALVVLFLALRRALGPWIAISAVSVAAVNPEIVRYAGALMSEPAYLLISLLTLYVLLIAAGRQRWLLAAGALALTAALTRSIGVTVIGAVLVHWALERRWKLLALPAIVSVVALAAWLIWTAIGPSQYAGSSYIAELRSLWSGLSWTGGLPIRFVRSLRTYATDSMPWMLRLPAVPGTPIDNVLVLLIAVVLLGAGGLRLWRVWRPAALYLLLYAGLLLAWLWPVGRFLVPTVPLLFATMLTGAHVLASRIRRAWALPATAALAAILLVSNGAHTLQLASSRAECRTNGDLPSATCMSPDAASWFEAVRWIRANVPAGQLMLTAKLATLWHYTGHQSIPYEEAAHQDSANFLRYVTGHGAQWILLGSLEIREAHNLAPLLQANCARLTLAAEFPPRTYLFRVAEPSPEEAAHSCDAVAAYLAANEGRNWEVHH